VAAVKGVASAASAARSGGKEHLEKMQRASAAAEARKGAKRYFVTKP
jgi:hypothetical protein